MNPKPESGLQKPRLHENHTVMDSVNEITALKDYGNGGALSGERVHNFSSVEQGRKA